MNCFRFFKYITIRGMSASTHAKGPAKQTALNPKAGVKSNETTILPISSPAPAMALAYVKPSP